VGAVEEAAQQRRFAGLARSGENDSRELAGGLEQGRFQGADEVGHVCMFAFKMQICKLVWRLSPPRKMAAAGSVPRGQRRQDGRSGLGAQGCHRPVQCTPAPKSPAETRQNPVVGIP
jgi:hypothetical protein